MAIFSAAQLGFAEFLVIMVIPTIIVCKVCSKAGYHWALGLLTLRILSVVPGQKGAEDVVDSHPGMADRVS